MGSISEGMRYLRAREYKKGVDDLMYISTDCEFSLSSEYVRVPIGSLAWSTKMLRFAAVRGQVLFQMSKPSHWAGNA